MALSKVDLANQVENILPETLGGTGASQFPAQFRNIIINGDMSIAQRGTTATGLGNGDSGYHTCDRWRFNEDGSPTYEFTMSQETDVPTGQGFAKSLKLDCTTAQGSLASSDTLRIWSVFEGQYLQYLKKGTSNAESLTASFWVKSNKTGTYIVELFDNDNTRQISKSYTIDTANTWEKKTITYAGDTTGALDSDNGASLYLIFWLGAGTNWTSGTLSDTWTSSTNANRVVGQVNLADDTANNFWITGVQLEAGTTASDFEFLPWDVNMNRCQRYYQKSYDYGTSLGTATSNGVVGKSGNTAMGTTTSEIVESATLLKEMRSAPTITVYDTAGNVGKVTTVNFGVNEYANETGSGYRIGTKYFAIQASSLSNLATSFSCHFTANAEL